MGAPVPPGAPNLRRPPPWQPSERLTWPPWHVAVAIAALLMALAGAVQITLANKETEVPQARADSVAA